MSVLAGRLLLAAALLGTVGSTLRHYPHQLAYFNELAGGPENSRLVFGSSNPPVVASSEPAVAAIRTARLIEVLRSNPSTADRQTPAFSVEVVAIELGRCPPDIHLLERKYHD
jgi:hypothetical protein